MEELKEYEMIFDDRELDELEGTEEETIELDEEFEKQVSKAPKRLCEPSNQKNEQIQS